MIKEKLRKILTFLKLDLTKNLKYDRLTDKFIKEKLKLNSNCLDVGCHKGEVLDLMLKKATEGHHIGFEPIPEFYHKLRSKYGKQKNVEIYNIACSDSSGEVTFNYVKGNPAYSGLKKRNYDGFDPKVSEILVQKEKLDTIVSNQQIDFIKIDVEGAEFEVLKGAKNILKHSKPILLFEFGLGASNYYGVKPREVYYFLEKYDYKISSLPDYFKNKFLTCDEFLAYYKSNKEYYFVAIM